MLKATRILVDVERQLAFVQMESAEGQAVYEVDARGDVFERVSQAVLAVNRLLERRKSESIEGLLSEVAKMF